MPSRKACSNILFHLTFVCYKLRKSNDRLSSLKSPSRTSSTSKGRTNTNTTSITLPEHLENSDVTFTAPLATPMGPNYDTTSKILNTRSIGMNNLPSRGILRTTASNVNVNDNSNDNVVLGSTDQFFYRSRKYQQEAAAVASQSHPNTTGMRMMMPTLQPAPTLTPNIMDGSSRNNLNIVGSTQQSITFNRSSKSDLISSDHIIFGVE